MSKTDTNLKVNPTDKIESVEIFLNEEKHPIAYGAKKKELMESGMDEKEAEQFIREVPFVMELYYSPNNGLFLMEAEALESIAPYNPYTGEQIPNEYL